MLWAQCLAALNPRQTIAIGQTREKSRIELPIVRAPTVMSAAMGDNLSRRDVSAVLART
jgi:hypothetical protein